MPSSGAATRTLSIALGLGAVGLALALTWQGVRQWHPAKLAKIDGADGGTATYAYDLDASLPSLAIDLDASDLAPRPPRDGGPGFTMPDGHPPPPLPADAPRIVRFGVVLVTYAGAEDAPHGARNKHDALELAEKLAAQAKSDFHAAVRRGDDGSADDVGTMRQGVIEPAPEYVLFSLPVDGVSGPIDTPRGYWIVKRIE
jgi:hypothetical protein